MNVNELKVCAAKSAAEELDRYGAVDARILLIALINALNRIHSLEARMPKIETDICKVSDRVGNLEN